MNNNGLLRKNDKNNHLIDCCLFEVKMCFY